MRKGQAQDRSPPLFGPRPFDGEKLHLEIGPQQRHRERQTETSSWSRFRLPSFQFPGVLEIIPAACLLCRWTQQDSIKSCVRHLAGYSKNCGGRTGQDARAHLNLKNNTKIHEVGLQMLTANLSLDTSHCAWCFNCLRRSKRVLEPLKLGRKSLLKWGLLGLTQKGLLSCLIRQLVDHMQSSLLAPVAWQNSFCNLLHGFPSHKEN